MIPDTAFVVKQCSVSDKAVEGSHLDLVTNYCPVENGLGFTWGESTATEVKFQFTSFIFPQSADSADMTLSCDISFCSTGDADCLNGCSGEKTTPSLDPSEMFILAVRTKEAYVISGDENSKQAATITAPAGNYFPYAQHAVIGDQLFIFGGESDKTKIAVLRACNFEEKSEKLLNDIDGGSAALSIDGDSRVLLCFSLGYNKNHCEIFDGTSSTSTTSSNYGHGLGRLGFYQNQPTTVGSHDFSDTKKVETLTSNGWSVIGDPPISDIFAHVLVGLQSGNLLMLGGYSNGNRLDHVWLLSNDSWSRAGTLKSSINSHSSLRINDSIFLIPGDGTNWAIQRVDMDGDEIKSSEIIGNNSGGEEIPVLFQVSAGFCA